MIIVIDAYNILKNIKSNNFISESNRNEFIKLLNAYAKEKNHNIILVFDGFDSDGLAAQRTVGSVKVIYSGKHTADEYIKYYIENNFISDITVVSTDRSIQKFVLEHNMTAVDSLVFYKFLSKFQETQKKENINRPQKKGVVYKFHKSHDNHDNNSELDALMLEGSKDIKIKEEANNDLDKKKSKSETLNKEEKKIQKILNKL